MRVKLRISDNVYCLAHYRQFQVEISQDISSESLFLRFIDFLKERYLVPII